ncbi:hypothetical protein AB0A76_09190 [Streptomyces exfoliatus]|uniref:Uncharacterized protein n=1 Tax=Streptomyces exfoliatus TaxID=1905 RepID=A0ABV3CT31_STREX
MTNPMSEQQLAEIARLIGEAKPATDALLTQLGESVRDRLAHDHSTQREDWYCMNLTSFMGERMGWVLRRLLDVEAEAAQLRARVAELEARSYDAALPWAVLMDADDLESFLAELAEAASGTDDLTTLAEVEKTCSTWRLIAEAQHAHNTAPGGAA